MAATRFLVVLLAALLLFVAPIPRSAGEDLSKEQQAKSIPAPPPDQAGATEPSWVLWGAVAIGYHPSLNGVYFPSAAVIRNQRSMENAIAGALDLCDRKGAMFCRVINTFHGAKCRYVAMGGTNNNGVSIGFGATPAQAIKRCAALGDMRYECKMLVGGCNGTGT